MSVPTAILFDMEYLAWLVVGITVGALAAWLVSRAVQTARTAEQSTEVEHLKTEAAQAQVAAAAALSTMAEVKAELAAAQAQRDAAITQATEITRDREQLMVHFKALSAEAIEAQEKRLDASAELRLKATEQLLAPVKEGLTKFDARINQVEQERVRMTTELKDQVSRVRSTGDDLRKETAALVTALRKPQVRGAWGELQLKRVVELAGMVEHCDFELQETTRTTAGATIRPDLKVMLSEDRYIYVDSKVPLAAFLEAQEATDEQLRAERLNLFARNVQTHINQLSAKDYYKAGGATPEFVVLFLGSEALAVEAFNQLPDLHEYAAQRRVVLATPSSLIALLKTASFAWRQAALAESAREVFDLGRELYDRLGVLGKHFDKVGRSLNGAVDAYNHAVGSIEGRVFPTARKLRDLKVTDKELEPVKTVDARTRQVSADELVEDAAAVTPLIGRTRNEAPAAEPESLPITLNHTITG
ncbi:MAG: DNA recombination protein RmuC [Propionicimonas sp.]